MVFSRARANRDGVEEGEAMAMALVSCRSTMKTFL